MRVNKIIVVAILVMLLAGVSFASGTKRKEIRIFIGAGTAAMDMRNVFVDLGIEQQFFGNLYGQFMLEYYNNPSNLPENSDSSAYGVNLYGVYKIPVSDKFKFFLKGGVHMTIQEVDMDWVFGRVEGTSTNLGLGGGAGIEYSVSNIIALYGGTTIKMFLDDSNTNATWFKFYGGISFKVK
ncbi:MAG: porin family protein [bacterium]|nr:porin family protein [bacterium]